MAQIKINALPNITTPNTPVIFNPEYLQRMQYLCECLPGGRVYSQSRKGQPAHHFASR